MRNRRMPLGGMSVLVMVLAALPARAQPEAAAAAAPTAAETGCELHAWPGDAMMSVYYGWFHGGIVNGQIQGRPGYPAVPPDPVDTAVQAAILSEAQPQRLLGHPEHRLVVHAEALPSRTIRGTSGRLSDSPSACYAELVVDDLVFQQDIVTGAYLKVLFRYRDFGPDALPRRSFATWSQTHLSQFPPRRPEQLESAIAEIREAYRRNIVLFTQAALRPPRRRR